MNTRRTPTVGLWKNSVFLTTIPAEQVDELVNSKCNGGHWLDNGHYLLWEVEN